MERLRRTVQGGWCRWWLVLFAWFGLISAGSGAVSGPEPPLGEASAPQQRSKRVDRPRLHWVFNADNDLFAGQGHDYGYTGGLSLTLTGGRLAETSSPGGRVLDRLDDWTRFGHLSGSADTSSPKRDSLQIGVLALTPEVLEQDLPVPGDRPYGSLAYVAHSRYGLSDDEKRLYQSTFTVGLLGTSIAEQMQKKIHGAIGLREPLGYGHQISEGGELTARYAVARHALLARSGDERKDYDLKFTLEASVGYLSEGAAALALRWGRRTTPWWSSASEYGEYAAQPAPKAPEAARRPGDFYFIAGIKARARFYNAFLQGQFRASELTFPSSTLRPVVLESWIGVVRGIGDVQVTYALRHQTAELRTGAGSRNLVWASLAIGKRLH